MIYNCNQTIHRLEQDGGTYSVTNRVRFGKNPLTANTGWDYRRLPYSAQENISDCLSASQRLFGTGNPDILEFCFAFSWEMSFGKTGHHRDHRSGGSYLRRPEEIFADTFQGKLAEMIVWNGFHKKGIFAPFPDFRIFGVGKWDAGDMILPGGIRLAVKSSTGKANLLLVEALDYNNTSLGPFPNAYAFVRIEPDVQKTVKGIKTTWRNPEEFRIPLMTKLLKETSFCYDIAGLTTRAVMDTAWRAGHIIPKNSRLGRFGCVMDADNLYMQTGDLMSLSAFCESLRSSYPWAFPGTPSNAGQSLRPEAPVQSFSEQGRLPNCPPACTDGFSHTACRQFPPAV